MQRRLIVELCHGAGVRTLRAAAELAAVLELNLHGLFVEDEALLALAERPFARELRLPSHEWQPMEFGRIAAELGNAAADARRLLHEAAATHHVPNAFQVWRGDPAEAIAAIASASDVIVIAEPDVPSSRIALALARLHGAARASAVSLLLLPNGFTPRQGRVVAFLIDARDASLAPAVRAALKTKNRLQVVLPHDDPDIAEELIRRAAILGLPRARVDVTRVNGFQSQDVVRALGYVREQLIVLTRDASPAGNATVAARIAADRAAPVLLIKRCPPPPQPAGPPPDQTSQGLRP
jgi:hypothetical protein